MKYTLDVYERLLRKKRKIKNEDKMTKAQHGLINMQPRWCFIFCWNCNFMANITFFLVMQRRSVSLNPWGLTAIPAEIKQSPKLPNINPTLYLCLSFCIIVLVWNITNTRRADLVRYDFSLVFKIASLDFVPYLSTPGLLFNKVTEEFIPFTPN